MKLLYTFDFDGEIEVLECEPVKTFIEIDASVSNNGIGAYEFHGIRGFDHGVDYIDDWKISRVFLGDNEVKFDELAPEIQKQIIESVENFVENWTPEEP